MKRYLALALLLLIVAVSLSAQTDEIVPANETRALSVSVSGTVYALDGVTPLEQIPVRVRYYSLGGYSATACTDASGNYTIPSVIYGTGVNILAGGSSSVCSNTAYTAKYYYPLGVWYYYYSNQTNKNFQLERSAALVTISDISVNEGNSGTGSMTFTATLDMAVSGGFTVDYATADGTATAGEDYTAKSGTLSFAGNANEQKTVTISINGDTNVETDETFTVALSNASTTDVIANDTATGTLTNDDFATLTINDVYKVEGNSGNSMMTFAVMVDNPVSGGFEVDYTTNSTTATAGEDYTASAGSLTFVGTAGETQNIMVTINGDTTIELDETFTVSLSTLHTGVIATDTAVGTILDDDGIVELLTNGGFEGDKVAGVPLGWVGKDTTLFGKDKQKCDKPDLGKYVAYADSCAFLFKGNPTGEKTKINQKLEDVSALMNGTTLTFSVYLDKRSADVGHPFGKLIVVYEDGYKDKIILRIADIDGYTYISDTVTVDTTSRNLSFIKAQFRNRLTSGKFFIDNASLTYRQAVGLTRDTLPLPDAPNGFRH